MTVLGWALLAVGGWILLSALTVTVWVWLGRWHNRRLFLRHTAPLSADPIGVDLDDARDNGDAHYDALDEHFALAAAVLQPDATPLADQVEEWLRRRTPNIRNATPDKEN